MYDVISLLTNKYQLTTLPRKPAFNVRKEILYGETASKLSDTGTYSMTGTSTSSEVEGKI